MKKALATILSALVILSFAGAVFAAEPEALPAGHPPIKAESKKAKKVKKAKKAKKVEKKEEAKPVEAPAAK
jgi:uncharacterized protein YxeA